MSLTTRIRIQGQLNPIALAEAIAQILKYPKGTESKLYVPEWDKENLRIEYPMGVGAKAHLYLLVPDHQLHPDHPEFIYDYGDQEDEPLYQKCNLEISLASNSDYEEREHHAIVNTISSLLATTKWYARNGYYGVARGGVEWTFKTSPYFI